MYAVRHSTDPDDPLSVAIAPPPGESAQERAQRLQREEEAKRVNDEIDERIKLERAAWKKQKSMFKLLLLGQSESGTSLVLPTIFPLFPRLVPATWARRRSRCPSPASPPARARLRVHGSEQGARQTFLAQSPTYSGCDTQQVFYNHFRICCRVRQCVTRLLLRTVG
ncbi:hypothetical protein C8Q80DRAFT_1272031 [Daedaleopsis nitida]|nr:hypothetical protein C8Q80DRAFT_1272031 [Daedaleopsis nitida]